MMQKEFASRIIHKHDIETNWNKATTFIPKQGEMIVYDIDDLHDYERIKIGDGVTVVTELPFYQENVAYIDTEDNETITDAEVNDSSGGANIDVVASVGQTIVVKEVDENSKPTAWGSADFLQTTAQTFTDEQKAQVRENIGVAGLDPDCHAEYFQITDDGVVSLKPEYRGKSTRTAYTNAISDMGSGVAGSKNSELPEHLIIPEIVDGIAVDALADGIFSQNLAIKYVTIPRTISAIPNYGFDQCWYLTAIYNTENITSLGSGCLQATAVDRVYFPNLETIGDTNVFYCCGHLVYVDIGNVTNITKMAFERCSKLNCIKNSGTITTVGDRAFKETQKLKRVNFISDLNSIGSYAFNQSKVEYDWGSLTNCTFGTNATSLQMNPTDFWSACTFTACENPIPTRFSQYDPRWADRVFTTWNGTGRTLKYSAGCTWLCAMHIYCGINNITLTSAPEFETIVDNIDSGLRNTFESSQSSAATFMNDLGLNATYYSSFNQTSLQAVYNALANGGYVCVEVGSAAKIDGHTVVIYGVNDDGDFLVLDSSSNTYDDRSIYLSYSLPYKNMIAPAAEFIIVTP